MRILNNNLKHSFTVDMQIINSFVIFKKKDHVQKFLRYTNSLHRNIKFACGRKKDNRILFLHIISNLPVEEKKTTEYCFYTFPSVEIITHRKHLSSVNLHLVVSTLILIVSHQQNIKEVCCTYCYRQHITFVPAICRFMKKQVQLQWTPDI